MHTRFRLILFLILLFNTLAPGQGALEARALTPANQAADLLSRMTPEERVGQLFLVTFQGTDLSPETPIYNLITRYHIGGVVLSAANNNFISGDQSLAQAAELTQALQTARWDASQQSLVNPISGEAYTPNFVPLFIGLAQEGDGYPYDQVLSGVTPLPNEMAIGATWNPSLATEVGRVLGQELSALGVNLLLGPSLDVLETPQTEGSNDLGTRTFGGDPFWVGEMGSEYIRGVHLGSQGAVAVIAKHFPGHGGSDRLPEEEVATVRKSLEELKNFELAPFFKVTGNAATAEAAADGLLASHIRYQGFQGNIRATTRPVSFDPQAFSLLMGLQPLAAWRENGGVMVSDNLGSRAIRRFYALNNQVFDSRRVALNAFQAGNDLLYVADFTSQDDPDSFNAAVRTLSFFAQKFREDPAFAQRVNEAALRLLALKFRLYGDFALEAVLAKTGKLDEVGKSSEVTFQVAREAGTLISPTQADLIDQVPDPPNLNDRIVFITDARTARQCSECPNEPLMDTQALQQVVLRLYGPNAGALVSPNSLVSYSLRDLQTMLDAQVQDTDIERDLRRANWIVFAMLNASSESPSFNTLSTFLAERPDLFQQKRLFVFAFNAPYYLDATNISKLTAYYSLYSKAPPFIDVAAYLLFRELRPTGALPVSIAGVYDLNAALFPDPNQTFPLFVDLPNAAQTITSTVTPEPPPQFTIGQVIPIRTGVILDYNGHPVQDGTPVEFIQFVGGEERAPRQVENTVNGIARTTFQVTSSGTLEIRAESANAKSATLKFDIPSPNGEAVTPTELPTPTPTPTPSPTPTPTQTAPPSGVQPTPEPPAYPLFSDWIMAVLVSAAIAFASYRLATLIGQVRWGVRAGFLVLIGGLLSYTYLALKMPGSETLLENSGSRGILMLTLLGAGLGLAGAWLWRRLSILNDAPKT